MKSTLFASCLISFGLLFFVGCKGRATKQPRPDASSGAVALETGNETHFKVDPKESVITWKGSNTFGTHEGYVSISKGELLIEDDQLAGGTVVVNMTTIEDEEHKGNSGLIKHLKDPDFFDVDKFTSSTIAITTVGPGAEGSKIVGGNLTIKGITDPVSFPASIEIKDGLVRASGKLVIDRTLWDVRYNSGKFFDNLKDEAIDDSIELNVTIVAKK